MTTTRDAFINRCYGLANLAVKAMLSKDFSQFTRESVEFIQNSDVFLAQTTGPARQDATKALPILASEALEKNGGIRSSDSFSGRYNLSELKDYFLTFQEAIPGAALVLISGGHAISVSYDNETKKWMFFDPYQFAKEGTDIQYFDSADQIAQSVRYAFAVRSVFTTFATEIVTTVKQPIQEWLTHDKMQAMHRVTKDKVKPNPTNSSEETWLYVAAQRGHYDTVQKLLHLGADPDATFRDGSTPLSVARQQRDEKMERILVAGGAIKSPAVHHRLGYGTAEHEGVGDAAVTLGFDGIHIVEFDVFKIQGEELTAPHFPLQKTKFGQILGSPDYFALPKGSISNYLDPKNQTPEALEQRFEASYNALAIAKLESEMKQIDAITHAGHDEYVETIDEIECCGPNYLAELEQNFDHFAPDAWVAYKTGHQIAMKMAKKSHDLKESDPAKAKQYLETAYAIEAYALHYATDNFSAGHIRVPRRALVNKFGAQIGGALSNSMHDEDSKFSIKAKNARGDEWVCYGDGQLNNPLNARSKELVSELVKVSAAEIYNVFQTGVIIPSDKIAGRQLFPKSLDDDSLSLEEPYQFRQNAAQTTMPLFREEKGTIFVRKDLRNVACADYEELKEPHAIIDAVILRIAAAKAPAKLNKQSPFDMLKAETAKALLKFVNFTPTSAFFDGSRDSKASATLLSPRLQEAKNENEYLGLLFGYLTANTKSTHLTKDLIQPIKQYADALGGNIAPTKEGVSRYLAGKLGLPMPEKNATSCMGCA